jgi:transposase
VFERPRELARLRAAVRAHRLITSDIVRVKNRLRALFRSRGVTVTAQIYESATRTKLLAVLPEDSRYQVEILGKQLDALEPLREQTEGRIREEAKRVPSVAVVATLPGFGVIRAATLVAVTITANRFRTTRQFWNDAGLGIVTRSSSDWVRNPKRSTTRRNTKVTSSRPRPFADSHPRSGEGAASTVRGRASS